MDTPAYPIQFYQREVWKAETDLTEKEIIGEILKRGMTTCPTQLDRLSDRRVNIDTVSEAR